MSLRILFYYYTQKWCTSKRVCFFSPKSHQGKAIHTRHTSILYNDVIVVCVCVCVCEILFHRMDHPLQNSQVTFKNARSNQQ